MESSYDYRQIAIGGHIPSSRPMVFLTRERYDTDDYTIRRGVVVTRRTFLPTVILFFRRSLQKGTYGGVSFVLSLLLYIVECQARRAWNNSASYCRVFLTAFLLVVRKRYIAIFTRHKLSFSRKMAHSLTMATFGDNNWIPFQCTNGPDLRDCLMLFSTFISLSLSNSLFFPLQLNDVTLNEVTRESELYL